MEEKNDLEIQQESDEVTEEEALIEEDLIRIPPGWGPVVFLAVVILLSNVGLGLYMRSLMLSTPSAQPIAIGQAGGGGAMGPGPGGPGKKGAGALSGAGGPEAVAPLQASVFQADEAEFTDELDAYVREVAVEAGLEADEVPSAKEVYEQMKRSNLLPRSQDMELRVILAGHLQEMGRSGTTPPPGGSGPMGGPGSMGGPEAMDAPGALPGPMGPGAKGAPGASKPAREDEQPAPSGE
jgi:hypothetical protein